VPVTVLGEQFVKPSGVANNTLARTGSDVRVELFWAGLALMLGGFGGFLAERKRGALAQD
jgi:LPXTG-motif cell wall-anchored protein